MSDSFAASVGKGNNALNQSAGGRTSVTELVNRRVLNLGCGRSYLSEAVNVDLRSSVGADIVHDLNSIPWPLPNNHFDTALLMDVIEHLRDVIATLEETHRVCRDGARIRIATPHFSCHNSYTDPTHLHHLGYFSFHYFTNEHNFDFYTAKRFRRIKTEIVFRPTMMNKLVWRLANRYPTSYERRWAWLFLAWFLSVELEVVK